MEIVVLIIDLMVMYVFFYMLIKNLQGLRMRGATKALATVLIIWGVARIIGMDMVTTVFGTMMGYVVLLVVILFPEEFRKMLDRYGRKRKIFNNTERFLGSDERMEVAEAMMEMSRRRMGFLLVVAKESDLEDEIMTGDLLGEVVITKDMLMNLWDIDGSYRKGAMIVKDNMILSANSILPIGRRDDLIEAGAGSRHLAALGITYAEDCVALVVSETTGKITIASKKGRDLNYHFALETREHNIRNGLDVTMLRNRIEEAFTGKDGADGNVGKKEMTKEDRKKALQLKKEQKDREREERKKELEERKKSKREGKRSDKSQRSRRKKGKGEGKTKSKGFGGYPVE